MTLYARFLAPLVKARGFGMTQFGNIFFDPVSAFRSLTGSGE